MSNNSAESTLNFCTTIIANPDISGIGVRVSIYAGAILNMVTSRIAMSKGDEAAITEAHRNSLLTSTGLVISAIIEWKTQGLTHQPDGVLDGVLGSLSYFCSFYIYNIFVGYWGIQVWLNPLTFGIPPNEENCTASSQTIFVLFGHNLVPSNPGLRRFALFYFGLIAVGPPLFLLLIMLVFYREKGRRGPKALSRSTSGSDGQDSEIWRKQGLRMFALPSATIYLMVTVEQMVERNPVKAQLNKWTFGQTLALIMLIQQLIACLSLFKKYYMGACLSLFKKFCMGGKHAKSSASSPEDGAVPPDDSKDEGESEK